MTVSHFLPLQGKLEECHSRGADKIQVEDQREDKVCTSPVRPPEEQGMQAVVEFVPHFAYWPRRRC